LQSFGQGHGVTVRLPPLRVSSPSRCEY
jgi:hypothetical protein